MSYTNLSLLEQNRNNHNKINPNNHSSDLNQHLNNISETSKNININIININKEPINSKKYSSNYNNSSCLNNNETNKVIDPLHYRKEEVVKEESDAYDVVQDTFVDFIEVYPRLQTKEMPIKYLYGIAHNKIADYWKEKKRTNESSIDEEDLSYEMTFQDVTEEDIDDIRRIVVVKLRRSERRLYIEVWRQKRKPKDLAAE